MAENTKQVIVIRRDLKMRRGKEISQGAHASMMWLTCRIRDALEAGTAPVFLPHEERWIRGLFTKVTVQVPNQDTLNFIFAKAKLAGVEAHLVVDSGLTEFHNEPTVTALGVGPHEADVIDQITGHLTLY